MNAPSPSQVEEMRGCVCFQLRRTVRAVTQLYDRALRPYGLRATQLPILVAVSRAEAVELAPLATQLGMDRTTLLRNVRPLVRRKLLRVGPSTSSRRTVIRMTAAGQRLLARAYPAWRKAQDAVLMEMGSEWPRTLNRLESLESLGRRARA
jgi:DNA-binding MarR family transcriptional regulator